MVIKAGFEIKPVLSFDHAEFLKEAVGAGSGWLPALGGATRTCLRLQYSGNTVQATGEGWQCLGCWGWWMVAWVAGWLDA